MTNRILEPRNARSRRTRAAILRAAWLLLEEQGGGAVTMGEVGKQAGVSRRTLYLHFASRGDLLRELARYVDEVLDLESSVRPVAEAPNAVAALEAFATHLVRYHPQILAINRAVSRGDGSGDDDLGALIREGLAAWHAACVQVMGRLAAEERLASPWTVDTAADMLLALMRDDVVETLAVEREWSTEQYRSLLITLLNRTFVSAVPR